MNYMSRLFRRKEKGKGWLNASSASARRAGNRILEDKKVGVELINPWRIAFELKEKVGLTQNFIQKENAPKEGDSLELQISLPQLDVARTFFKENPDFEL